MQLSYRGLSYEANTRLVDSTESNVLAQYRGLPYSVRRPVNKLGVQSPIALKFRAPPTLSFNLEVLIWMGDLASSFALIGLHHRAYNIWHACN